MINKKYYNSNVYNGFDIFFILIIFKFRNIFPTLSRI